MKRQQVVGFIGMGVMGRSMASHLMAKGYQLSINTRTKAKAEELIAKGAKWCDSAKEVAQTSDVMITMVGFPSEVAEVYFGEEGILSHGKAGSYVIDMSTSEPTLAIQIYEEAKKRGLIALDAPVSGGDRGAKAATLSIMVGGDEEAFNAMRPVFEAMGTNIVYQGPAGSGQHTKMSNQIAIAAGMLAVTEALAYAKKAGLNPEKVLKSIESGAAGSWSLSNLGPRMLGGDFAPGFYVKHFVKDMQIAVHEAKKMELQADGLALALEKYQELVSRGGEDFGTQALFKLVMDEEG
jgi:3-hydroxyisobutyrate dehydrogenase